MRRAEAGKLGGTSGKGAKEDKEVKDVEQVKEGENAQLVWVPAIAWCRLLAGELAPASHASRAGPGADGLCASAFSDRRRQEPANDDWEAIPAATPLATYGQ